jgi:hypothetical protein
VRGTLTLLLVAVAVYAGMKMIPVRARVFQFDDAVQQQALTASSQRRQPSVDQIRARLLARAEELGLPIRDRDLRVSMRGTSHLTIDARYVVPIEFVGGFVYEWEFRSQYDGPIIR